MKFVESRTRSISAVGRYSLKNLNIAVPNSIETIAHARVPILKFVDKLTGLRVDLSFDNDSGLVANETFQQWKAEYPAMPVIVVLQKTCDEASDGKPSQAASWNFIEASKKQELLNDRHDFPSLASSQVFCSTCRMDMGHRIWAAF
jgi:hypothetical protein